MVTVIIPAAGFGSRMKNHLVPGQSKELLEFNGEYLINRGIKLCRSIKNVKVVVVTRAEKTDLIHHLKNLDVKIHIVPKTKEWTESVLLSEPHWTDWNVVLLPDTDFSPLSAFEQISKIPVENIHWKAAVFMTAEPSKWGIIDQEKTSVCLRIAEKPYSNDSSFAWGLLAFRKEFGKKLWHLMVETSEDHKVKEVKGSGELIELKWFKDLTRI